MNLWQGLESVKQPFEATSVAAGTFDGLHRGHQALIVAAVADARASGRESVVFTFDRHPAELIAPDRVPGYLNTPAQRIRIVEALGVDHLVIATFDQRFRQLSPEGFLRFVLIGVLGARAVMVGQDFRFGHDQKGDIAYLTEAQDRFGFTLQALSPVMVGGEKASSSRVRQLLREGDIVEANAVLGRPYELSGTVVEGQKLGRELGFPTANMELEIAQVVPADGIYAVWAEVKGTRCMGACSIGVRPTVGGTQRTIETYLLDFDGDLYGKRLDIAFIARLRDERKFDSLDALAEQMGKDVEQARRILRA